MSDSWHPAAAAVWCDGGSKFSGEAGLSSTPVAITWQLCDVELLAHAFYTSCSSSGAWLVARTNNIVNA